MNFYDEESLKIASHPEMQKLFRERMGEWKAGDRYHCQNDNAEIKRLKLRNSYLERRLGMKDYGWSYGDLAGELWARGIDIEDVELSESILNERTAERAAERIDDFREEGK
jgi:hypothetical protein